MCVERERERQTDRQTEKNDTVSIENALIGILWKFNPLLKLVVQRDLYQRFSFATRMCNIWYNGEKMNDYTLNWARGWASFWLATTKSCARIKVNEANSVDSNDSVDIDDSTSYRYSTPSRKGAVLENYQCIKSNDVKYRSILPSALITVQINPIGDKKWEWSVFVFVVVSCFSWIVLPNCFYRSLIKLPSTRNRPRRFIALSCKKRFGGLDNAELKSAELSSWVISSRYL